MNKDKFQLVVTALGTLLLLSLVALLVVTLLWRTDQDDSGSSGSGALIAAGREAEAAARDAVVAMTTYDYRTIEDDFAWVEDAGTAKFRDQYAEVSAPIKELVVQLKAKAVGTVVASAPDVEDPDHVTVLLFVDQEIANPGTETTGPQRGLDQPRVTMEMVREDGEWLVDEVQLSTLNGR